MPYAEGRVIHDADAHTFEVPGFLDEYLEPQFRVAVAEAGLMQRRPGLARDLAALAQREADPAWRDTADAQIMLRKNRDALGAFRKEDRSRALDQLGFASQLVFTTELLSALPILEDQGDLAAAAAGAEAHNRYMVDFCAADPRLLPTGYVPLADFDLARRVTEDAIRLGCKALMIASRCPPGHSPSHIGLDPVWAQAEAAGLPIVFHVGGGGRLLNPDFFANGLPPVPDFHGGDDNFRSVDYLAIQYPPMQAVAVMIIDRVLDRFPELKLGIIEQGASWVPGWMRAMDSAHRAFYKNEERLQQMALKPSEYVRRQIRVTPYPHEDAGWIIANAGEEVCLFSSDYPHVEGGRNPLKRFEESMADVSVTAKRRFYCDNFIDLMGAGLAPELRHPVPRAA